MVIKYGFKLTEAGYIPDDWIMKSFDELFTFNGGLTASRAKLSSTGLCYLHYGDIHKSNKTFVDVSNEFSELPKLNTDMKKVSNKVLLKDGDTVFVDASEDDEGASRHIVVRNKDEIPFISGLHTIVCKSKDESLDNLFKEFCFQSEYVKKQFKYYSAGTKVCGVNKNNIKKILLPIPLQQEQKLIAKSLSEIDKLLLSIEKLIDKKKKIKQGTMQQLLTDKKRLPGFSGEWEKTEVSRLLIIKKGYQLNKDVLTQSDDFPVINGGIEPSGYTFKWNTNENTITISEGGNSCGYINFIKSKFWAGGHVYVVKPINNSIHYFFIYYILKYNELNIMALRVGSGLPNIQRKSIEEFELFIPKDIQEQKAIANILTDMDSEIESLQQKLIKYKKIKQGMMQELLTGRIRLI